MLSVNREQEIAVVDPTSAEEREAVGQACAEADGQVTPASAPRPAEPRRHRNPRGRQRRQQARLSYSPCGLRPSPLDGCAVTRLRHGEEGDAACDRGGAREP